LDETIVLDGKPYKITRSKLKSWIELESLKTKALDFSKRGRAMEFCDCILSYISIASGVEVEQLEKASWVDIVFAWEIVVRLNQPNPKLPLYAVRKLDKEKEPVWEYEGRTWYVWIHSLSSKYGWSMEYIAELDIDDASSLLQEIFTEEQLDREFQWMMSEIAYPYNESSKKSEFKPLHRPVWMMEEIRAIKEGKDLKMRIRKDHMPVGNIIKWDEKHAIN
jgi:hypothetical protein